MQSNRWYSGSYASEGAPRVCIAKRRRHATESTDASYRILLNMLKLRPYLLKLVHQTTSFAAGCQSRCSQCPCLRPHTRTCPPQTLRSRCQAQRTEESSCIIQETQHEHGNYATTPATAELTATRARGSSCPATKSEHIMGSPPRHASERFTL